MGGTACILGRSRVERSQTARDFLSPDATRLRHVGTSPNVDRYNPDLWTDELAFLSQPAQDRIQLDLFYDYRTNVASYPRWQEYLRSHRPPTLVVWGKYDPSFTVAARPPMDATSPMPRSTCWRPGTSRSTRRRRRSRRASTAFLSAHGIGRAGLDEAGCLRRPKCLWFQAQRLQANVLEGRAEEALVEVGLQERRERAVDSLGQAP